jgi:2-amino-4-hydroxy-6-hydroxymethyldihydropteridine diphosphokinase
MTNGSEAVYVAIGSNIEPGENIVRALDLLTLEAPIDAMSGFYESPALDRPTHPPFVNGVCRVRTNADPRSFQFQVLNDIEDRLGRVRGDDAYGPRVIDLDLILYGGRVVNDTDFHLPDPDIRDRPFLSVPLFELDPDIVLPDTGQPLRSVCPTVPAGVLKALPQFTAELRERFLK